MPIPQSSFAASIAVASVIALAGCTTTQTSPSSARMESAPGLQQASFRPVQGSPAELYRPMQDSGFAVAGLDTASMNPDHVRQVVDYPTRETPGTIVVDQTSGYLYFILPDGKAVRYAVGVGPVARAFPGGEAEIARKAAWPRWIPTSDMIKRNPKQYARNADGVDGGPGNPMGARALYMHQNGIDTYYRVHGTNDPSSIGRSVSAGCIRLLNQDIIDLHDRVQPGARIVVH